MQQIRKVAGVVIKDNAFLMVRKNGRDIWTNLGGHIEHGETEEQALVREVKEELGCDCTITRKLTTITAPAAHDNAQLQLMVYLIELFGKPVICDPELAEFAYIGADWQDRGIALPESITQGLLPYMLENKLLDWN